MSFNASIAERLAAYPPKAQVPVQGLLRAKLVDEATVEEAMNAVELAGQPDRLAPFVTAVLYLRSQGVQVRDVVAMARDNKRRIRLDWSPRRWQEEHAKLSQLQTVRQLAAANTRYDLQRFEKAVPRVFRGYLIRSSRRLAMEGLWQRHCVAVYHERILEGQCAIAVLFIDGKRWTVELEPAPTKKGIRIAQIAARFNEKADQLIWRKANAMLRIRSPKKASVSTILARLEHDQALNRRLRSEQLSRVLPVLRRLQIEEVVVSFDGSGDSGTVDSPAFVPYRAGVREAQVTVPKRVLRREGDVWESRVEEHVCSLEEAVRDICDNYADATGVDWYNNDGGFGQMVIRVREGTVSMEINQRFTETELAFQETLAIEEPEQA